jgi:uncharacterized membrane protein YhfC
MMGAGHGGIEAIILGVLVLLTYVSMLIARGVDLSGLVPAAQQGLAEQQIQAYWSTPWYFSLFGALERVFAITFHVAASVLVLQVFVRRQIRWLWFAVGLHTLQNAVALVAAGKWGPMAAEAALALLMLVSLAIIFGLRQPDPVPAPEPPPAEPVEILEAPSPEETPENLEQTRYD